MKSIGIVEWACGRGCSRGQPYGEHGDCGMRVVKTLGDYPDPAEKPRYPTIADALNGPPSVQGWNLRCRLCATFGATWKRYPDGHSVALCPRDMRIINELEALPKKLLETDIVQLDRSEVDKEFAIWRKEQKAKQQAAETAARAERRQMQEARQAAKAAHDEAHQEALPAHGIFEQGPADR